MNLEEVQNEINYIMDNNVVLENKGLKPYTICLEGSHGIGKTAIVEEIASKRNATFVKVNLGAFEEVGDLTGFPIKKYKMLKDGEGVTVAEASLKAHIDAGYELIPGSDPVMDFAIPSWVPEPVFDEDGNPRQQILMLDDYSRANQLVIQATMELLDKGELGTWTLPVHTQIFLTSNPDNGEYSVASMDNAQKTRFLTFNVDFDVKLLAKHMEEVEVRSEFINFALMYPEIFNTNKNNTQATGRTYMAFARVLESVIDLSSEDGRSRALSIAEGIFDDKDNIIGSSFTLFINNKLDKLITPEDLVHKPWKDVAKILEKSIGHIDSKNYRVDIAATLSLRLVNYTLMQFDKKGTSAAPFIDRILDITNHKHVMLSQDLIYSMVRKLFTNHASKCTKLFTDDKFKDMFLS